VVVTAVQSVKAQAAERTTLETPMDAR